MPEDLQPFGRTGQNATVKRSYQVVGVSALAPGTPDVPDKAVALLLIEKPDGTRAVVLGKVQGSEVVPVEPIL